jgi:diketogulonate reductase-like aldo/keto reductase
VTAGKIGRWGVSKFDEISLAGALAIAGPGRIACNQVLYHLGQRAIEHAVLPFCQAHGIALVGYSPFGAGAPEALGLGAEASRTLARVAAANDATVRQVALAFLTHQAGTFVIPKAVDPAHIEENAGAATLILAAEDLTAIARAFPLGERRWGVPLAAAGES